jgi:hypothetical protein
MVDMGALHSLSIYPTQAQRGMKSRVGKSSLKSDVLCHALRKEGLAY